MTFLLILLIPILIALVGFFLPRSIITWKEFLTLLGVSVVVAGISMGIIYYQNVYYSEVWNGLVVKKERVKVSCRHSYQCNCVTTCSGGKNSSCTTICQTCYDHPYDFDYNVYDSSDQEFTIDTVDRQGVNIPPRFASIQMGEPTSKKHVYKNYVKASSGNLFKKQGVGGNFQVPPYPQYIYDYYRYDRIISVGVPINSLPEWNYKLSEINGFLGPKRQCNIMIVLVKNQPLEYFNALDQFWQGGNKNDIVPVISINDQNEIQWVNVLCFAQSDLFKVKLRDEILSMKTLDMEKLLSSIKSTTATYYQRKRMRDFEYLMEGVEPTIPQFIISLIINCIICLSLTIYFSKNKVY